MASAEAGDGCTETSNEKIPPDPGPSTAEGVTQDAAIQREGVLVSLLTEETGAAADDDDDERPLERWPPVGANTEDDDDMFSLDESPVCEVERLRHLEEEQEQLNASLLALTTHFAQVQFRLRQIVDSDPDQKEALLKDLEEFAFRGIPDTRIAKRKVSDSDEINEAEHEIKLQEQRQKQRELIEQLKIQLEELETYAYESGDLDLPQSVMLEKQKVIIDELKGKLPINLESFHALSPDELRRQVDHAINQLINPVKMKEQLVSQLKTQITDLERFIEFLQGENQSGGKPRCTCNCPMHGRTTTSGEEAKTCTAHHKPSGTSKAKLREQDEEMRRRTANVIRRALAVMQMFAVTQFGCGNDRRFRRNDLKMTHKANHWGDLRARFQVAIENVIELASAQSQALDSDYTSDSEDAPAVLCNEKLTTAVRKELAMSLRDLLQHGLLPSGQSTSLVPFMGCFPTRTPPTSRQYHIWEVLIAYYQQKNGPQYNATPARRLSQSFNLDIVGGTAITSKQTLLSAIGNVISSHTPLKRSMDSHFKAFVCAGLNEKKLVNWLRLILKSRSIIDYYYQPWSYVIKTGFDDAYRSLERLNRFDFDLPVDLAVRPFQNIRDVF